MSRDHAVPAHLANPGPHSGPIDAVLTARPPQFSGAEAVTIARASFAADVDGAVNLGSERDQTFLLSQAAVPVAVMKISNPAEDPMVLDMESAAVDHIGRTDPALAVARPWPVPGASVTEPAHRAAWTGDGDTHWVRCYDVIDGRGRSDAATFGDRALGEWGATTARLGRALRSFIHPRAVRTMPWDVQHAASARPMLDTITDIDVRSMVGRTLDRFEQVVTPVWPLLRAQVIHGDLTVDNALVDDNGFITGIVDFGDMSHTALVVDIASMLDSLVSDRHGDELLRCARLLLDGYQRITPLEDLELSLIGELWAARTAVGIAISSWRAQQGLEDPAFAQRFHGPATAMLESLLSIGWGRLAGQLSGDRDGATSDALAGRRTVFGPATEALSYDEPIRMVAAEGAFMIDADGRRYLDMYNNVPSIGHGHPRVSSAIARQSRVLNTNMRYLHGGAIELAERLVDSVPASLDTVFFVNSGSEANDLAWRLATTFTGNTGGLCTTRAYHGISAVIAPLSPETLAAEHLPGHIDRWAPTDTYRGLHTTSEQFVAALDRLAGRGVAPAMAILDGVLQSDGVYDLDPALVQEWVRLTHAAGGLWVADEVQGGYGRTGEAMWSFERFGIEPDVVTLGKPMGNGHPVAALITRREIAERFAADTVFFSTFGGNQVSVAAAHAVLDVIADERVLPRVVAAGDEWRSATRAATMHHDCIGDVRGIGLANAIEIVADPHTRQPDAALTDRMKNLLRRHGVLVGTTGVDANILKVRPPLAFTADDVPMFIDALSAALDDLYV